MTCLLINPPLQQVFSYPVDCLSLACTPGHAVTLVSSPPTDLPTKLTISQLPTSSVAKGTGTDNVPSQPLNISRANLAKHQHADKWLGPLYQYLFSQEDPLALHGLEKQVHTWVKVTSLHCKIIDDLIVYADNLMTDPHHYRIFIPSDPDLQRHLLIAYHDSPIGMHWGRDATYNTLSQDFYWRNMHKHVKNWVRRCPQCIRFKTAQPAHVPKQLRLYQHPFHTLGVDFVGELPMSPSGNKWILTAVCPCSNFL